MKKLFIITILFFPVLLFAQQKKAGDLIKKHLYIKLSPTLFAGDGKFRQEDGLSYSPAIFGTLGYKMRYAAIGFSAGHLHFTKAGNVTPWGADLTITDFKRKVFPVITVQWHQAHYSVSYAAPGTGFRYNTVSGRDMHTIGAGVALTVLKRSKLMATLGVSRMNYDIHWYSSTRPGSVYTGVYKESTKMPFIAISLVL